MPMILPVTEYRLQLARPMRPGQTPQLRGFFGRRFEEEVLIHHHSPDGRLVYDYPRVQFKVLDRMAVVIGIAEGSDLLQRLWLEVDETSLGNDRVAVLESRVRQQDALLGESEKPITYRFASPWLSLNQKNYARFTACRTWREKQQLLENILVGNVLSLAKSFGYKVGSTLTADCSRLRTFKTTLKGVAMIGFVGTARINFHIPNLIGLGKSVSRGFGVVDRIVEAPGAAGVK